jgi:hypothetical protein
MLKKRKQTFMFHFKDLMNQIGSIIFMYIKYLKL